MSFEDFSKNIRKSRPNFVNVAFNCSEYSSTFSGFTPSTGLNVAIITFATQGINEYGFSTGS